MPDPDSPTKPEEARVYVLRVWREPGASKDVWRASVREGAGGARKHFASLDALIEHLYGEMIRR